MNALFFWLFSGGMILCALAVILNRNAVASALCFTFTIVFMASLFVMLNAFFLAAVQILVTAGAVMVLFLFIIMLLDVGAVSHLPRQKIWMGATLLLALGFVYLLARGLDSNPAGATRESSLRKIPGEFDVKISESAFDKQTVKIQTDDTHRIGRVLFRKYVAPFEVTSLLILVATIGVVVLCKDEVIVRPKTEKEIDTTPRPRTEPALTASR